MSKLEDEINAKWDEVKALAKKGALEARRLNLEEELNVIEEELKQLAGVVTELITESKNSAPKPPASPASKSSSTKKA